MINRSADGKQRVKLQLIFTRRNTMKKLINWIIKKLGGYTREEYNKSEDSWFKIAKTINADYFEERDKYTAEHKAYLALLNCHNATAEAAQNGTAGVAGAIDTIKAYCASQDDCYECALYRTESGCKFQNIPCYWGE